jgi:hypothetical protein
MKEAVGEEQDANAEPDVDELRTSAAPGQQHDQGNPGENEEQLTSASDAQIQHWLGG